MTCVDARAHLAELALDALPEAEAIEVERHLRRCLACRKEAEELREGATTLALSLRVKMPPDSLESAVVDRVAAATGRRPSSRRALRLVTASALVAAVLAASSFAWAIAMRHQVISLEDQVSSSRNRLVVVSKLIHDFQAQIATNGKVFDATLVSARGEAGGGAALIVSVPKKEDFVLVDVNLSPALKGPFRVWLQPSASGRPILAGTLVRTPDGPYVLKGEPRFLARDLSQLSGVRVVDGSNTTILNGLVKPHSSAVTGTTSG